MIFRHSIQLGSYRSRRPPLLYLYDTILHLCDTYTCTISLLKLISALYRMSTRANREPTRRIGGYFHPLPHPRRPGSLNWSHFLIRRDAFDPSRYVGKMNLFCLWAGWRYDMHYKCHSTSICRFWGPCFTFPPLSSIIFTKIATQSDVQFTP